MGRIRLSVERSATRPILGSMAEDRPNMEALRRVFAEKTRVSE